MGFFDKLISLFSSKEKVNKPTPCCVGCKHLFYWNDGSAGCDLEKEDINSMENGKYTDADLVDLQKRIANK